MFSVLQLGYCPRIVPHMQNTICTEFVNGGRAEKPGFKYRKTRLERILFSITMASCLASSSDSVVILTEDDI